MSFIDQLDITSELTTLSKFVRDTKWTCTASVNNTVSRGSTVTLAFDAPNPSTGIKQTFISVTWTHSVTQLVGHYLYSGEWEISDVKFSGFFFDAAARLVRAKTFLSRQRQISFTDNKASQERLKLLEVENLQLKQQLEVSRKTAALSADKLKEATERLPALEEQNNRLVRELQSLRLQLSQTPFQSLPPPPFPSAASTSSSASDKDDDLFKKWAAPPPAG